MKIRLSAMQDPGRILEQAIVDLIRQASRQLPAGQTSAGRVHAARVWPKRTKALLRLLERFGHDPLVAETLNRAKLTSGALSPIRERHVLEKTSRKMGVAIPGKAPPSKAPIARAIKAIRRIRRDLTPLKAGLEESAPRWKTEKDRSDSIVQRSSP